MAGGVAALKSLTTLPEVDHGTELFAHWPCAKAVGSGSQIYEIFRSRYDDDNDGY